METHNRLELIRNLLHNYNTFTIYSLQYNEGIPVGYNIVIFKPWLYKKIKAKERNKFIRRNFDDIFINPLVFNSVSKQEVVKDKIDTTDASREILILIRDNHQVNIEDIYKIYKNELRKNIVLSWKELDDNSSLPLSYISNKITKFIKDRRENKLWDYDSNIFPRFLPNIHKDYYIKDVIFAIERDDDSFLRKVIKEGYYDEFLKSIDWDPYCLIGEPQNFNRIILDDFGDYRFDNNALIFCVEFSSYKCLILLLNSVAYPYYSNS